MNSIKLRHELLELVLVTEVGRVEACGHIASCTWEQHGTGASLAGKASSKASVSLSLAA